MRWIAGRALIALFIFCPFASVYGANLPLRVLTYNIWGLPSPADHATWRYGEIAKRVADYDVIAFEEAWSSTTDVVWQTPAHPYHAFGGQAHGVLGASGLMLASKFPIVESHFLAYHDCTGTDCLEKKGALMARVEVSPGVQVDFYMTHLNAWQDQDLIRTAQILELVGMMREYSSDNPIVLLGDFNAEFRSTNYWEILGSIAALRDSYEDYLKTIPNATVDQINGFSFDVVNNPWAAPNISHEDHSQRLDYIFYRGAPAFKLRVTSSKLVFTEPVRGDKPMSDHYALTTVFNIQTP